jgi:cytidyltransferase-like protein
MEWKVKNHGGDVYNDDKDKHAVFIGRFQPYHKGHIELINQKLSTGVPVLIMVRDVEPDNKNPFTAEQSVDMIRKYHESRNDNVKVMIIPDIESINFGRGVGYEVNEFTPPKELGWVSATTIRNCINNGDDYWRTMVDETIQDDVLDYLKECSYV